MAQQKEKEPVSKTNKKDKTVWTQTLSTAEKLEDKNWKSSVFRALS